MPKGIVFSFVSFFNQQLPLVTANPWEGNGQCLYVASGFPYQLAQIRSNCSEQQVSDHTPRTYLFTCRKIESLRVFEQ